MKMERPRICASRVTIVFLAMLLMGCAVNPVSMRPEVTFVSLEREKEIGARMAEQVTESIGLVKDARLTGYVEAIGARLVKYSPRQDVSYRFFVVDMAEPNAFALPAGYIYISRGLLALVNQEDELAGAMAHEIGHVAAKHAVQRVTAAVAASPIPIAAGLAGAAVGILSTQAGRAIADAGQSATGAILAPHGREQERDADRIGQDMVAKAGWDPRGLTSLLVTLDREEKLASGGEPRPNSFFATHPALAERVTLAAAKAEKMPFEPTAPIARNQAGFYSRLEGLMVGPNPSQGIFVGTRFFHPDFDFTIRFPDKWQTHNAPEMVVGLAPDKKALAFTQRAAKGNDPYKAAEALDSRRGLGIMQNAVSERIGGLPAVRGATIVRRSNGAVGIDFTWIAHNNVVYELIGISPEEYFGDRQKVYAGIARSFRPLTAEDRSQIKEARLRIIGARQGETLTQLLKRAGGTWQPQEAAVANNLDPDARLVKGRPVKVPLLQIHGSYKGT